MKTWMIGLLIALTTPLINLRADGDLKPDTAIQTMEQLYTIQAEIFEQLKSHEADLNAIREAKGTLIEKWQQFLQVILPIQLQVLKKYGLDDNQRALSQFNEQYMHSSAQYPALFELNRQKWLFLFDKAFGVTDFKEISLEKVQSLIIDIVEEMTSESFLQQVDDQINVLGKEATLLQKRQALLSVLFPLHTSVMAKHGFEGEIGYIQAQRAIMDYYYDPVISQKSAYAQWVVFKRAQLFN
jgi:hypothetical protein